MSKKIDKDYSFEAVPLNKRNTFGKMVSVMLALTFFSASMSAGGTLASGLSFAQVLLVILVGNALLGAFTAALGYIGAKTGLSTHILAQYSFGKKGTYINSFALSITQIGWFGVGIAMLAYPIQALTGWPLAVVLGIGGLLMTSTAYFGMRSMVILSMISVPAIILLGGWSSILSITEIGGISALFAHTPEISASLPVTAALTLTIGSFISAGTLTPDYTRFAKTPKQGLWSTVIAFTLGNSTMFLFGAIGMIATGLSDISDIMIAQGLLLPAMIGLGLNIWTTNDSALYASSLGFATIFKKPRVFLVAMNGLLGTVFATILFSNFISWLTILGSTLPAIGAIIIVDYFFIKKGHYPKLEEVTFTNINWPAIIAWGVGIIAGNFIPAGIAPINTVIAAAIGYVAVTKVMKAAPVQTVSFVKES